MTGHRFLVDTGPLVAFLNRRDRHHVWARDQLSALKPPLHTCEAVISEACFLVRQLPGGRQAVMALLTRGLVRVSFDLQDEIEPVAALVATYASTPMSLADACLVRMVEQAPRATLLTLDSDFHIYRAAGTRPIKTVSPELPR